MKCKAWAIATPCLEQIESPSPKNIEAQTNVTRRTDCCGIAQRRHRHQLTGFFVFSLGFLNRNRILIFHGCSSCKRFIAFAPVRTHAGESFISYGSADRERIRLAPLGRPASPSDRRGRHRGRHVRRKSSEPSITARYHLAISSNSAKSKNVVRELASPARGETILHFQGTEIPSRRTLAASSVSSISPERGESHRQRVRPLPPGHHDQRQRAGRANRTHQAKSKSSRIGRAVCCSHLSFKNEQLADEPRLDTGVFRHTAGSFPDKTIVPLPFKICTPGRTIISRGHRR